MENETLDVIGGAWLVQQMNLKLAFRLPVISAIAGRRLTEKEVETGFRTEFYPESQRPKNNIIAHLQFHLKNEIPHFALLGQLFTKIEKNIIQRWVNSEPTGQYARRSAFFYEFFTEEQLILPPNLGGNYIDAVNDKLLVTASKSAVEKNPRWRINNNLAGNRYFCPTLVKNDRFNCAAELDVRNLLNHLKSEIGEEFILRSTVWFTLGESRSSFQIEGEGNQNNRIQRFANVMENFTGKLVFPLKNLAFLQQELLGEQQVISQFGLRQSPVFVGSTIRFQNVVHYIAPPFTSLSEKLQGVTLFWEKTEGQSAIMRSAAVAFAFVYIHPLSDGNGRIHRFLFNDLLRRAKAIDAPIILPISGVIIENSAEKNAYAQILEHISKPLMKELEGKYYFTTENKIYPDGISSNFHLTDSQQAEYIWQYPDLTEHICYFARIVEKTISQYMRQESFYLRNHEKARNSIKEIIDMPDHYADRIIRSVLDNDGILTNKLVKEYPFLNQDDIWQRLVKIIQTSFNQ
ncbi:cell filamentation protein Fic [Rodentibacter trehalosifermentans]|uniref:Cell filamentation protein Fic n=1 Tax=Rodentibacter trehalosifermentans TaxID=1908263 RepID=A0A1V3J3R3_9PAST|nr:Fic family protein [Rodentibacter trehalosifermentans]OOF49737.1 cell filamentation protein Fic [Rodentibacter trehalosifermentans]